LLFAACAAWAQTGNVIPLGPSARVELITPSTIRVDRGKLPPVSRIAGLDDVEPKVTDTGSHVRIDTSDLAVTLDRAAATLSISAPSGLNLYQETASSPDGLELAVRDTERFYGLGPRPETRLSARGLLIPSPAPFFISSRGYGWWSATPLRSADMAS